jgi:erythromycin esterase
MQQVNLGRNQTNKTIKSMKFQVLTTLLTLSYCISSAQIKEYVLSESKPILSISPKDQDISDLSCIGKAIGDARVVMLGEQEHGDATTLEAKTKIVRYLCEEKGFDVLLFESDFWGLNDGWSKVPRQLDSLQKFVKSNVYPIWTNCHGCQYLFETWLPKYAMEHPVFEVSGFDPHMVLRWTTLHLLREIESLLNQQFPSNAYLKSNLHVLNGITTYDNVPADSNLIKAQLQYLDRFEIELFARFGTDDFWVQTMRSLKVWVQNRQNYRSVQSFNRRDEMMAENLIWLTDHKYKGRKVIVWAANAHVLKLSGSFQISKLNQLKHMGNHFLEKSRMKDSVYVIGFTSARGEAGMLGKTPYRFKTRGRSSFEKWQSKTGVKYAFVDFKAFNAQIGSKNVTFRMAGSGGLGYGHYSHKAPWHRIYDGVFYIRDMERCRPIKVGGKVLPKN